jgi:hypothetical protein
MQAPKVRTGVIVLAVASATVLTGCGSGSSGPAADGPLRSGVDGRIPRGSTCTPARMRQAVGFGFEQFTNYGHTAVILSRITLRQPRQVHTVPSTPVNRWPEWHVDWDSDYFASAN